MDADTNAPEGELVVLRYEDILEVKDDVTRAWLTDLFRAGRYARYELEGEQPHRKPLFRAVHRKVASAISRSLPGHGGFSEFAENFVSRTYRPIIGFQYRRLPPAVLMSDTRLLCDFPSSALRKHAPEMKGGHSIALGQSLAVAPADQTPGKVNGSVHNK